jgi:DNA polymerase-3 subunit epsilon
MVSSNSWLVNPGYPISPHASAVHGITTDMVRSAPGFAEVYRLFLAATTGAVYVAHNAPFDLGMLTHEAARHGLPPPPGPVLDTLRMSRRSFPALSSHSLGHLVDALALRGGRRHRSLVDSTLVMLLFRRCCSALQMGAADTATLIADFSVSPPAARDAPP